MDGAAECANCYFRVVATLSFAGIWTRQPFSYQRISCNLGLNTAYHYLDLLPKGRDEDGLPYGMAWVRYRDKYPG